MVGTPHYMAPEQFRTDSDAVTPAADGYALGVLLYELLTGRVPFRQKDLMELLVQVRETPPAPPRQRVPTLPRDLDSICLKCLEKEPSRRYASALALAEDLRRFQQGEPTQARPVRPLVRAWLWARRRPALAGLILGIVVAVLGGSGASLYFGFQALRRAAEADQAKGRAQQARAESDLRAAQLALREGLAQCEAGAVDRGLFTLLDALRQAPDDAGDFRRVVRANLAAWGRQLPVLRHAVVFPEDNQQPPFVRFVGADGETFLTAKRHGGLRTWDTATGQSVNLSWHLPDGEKVYDVSPDGTWIATISGSTEAGTLRDLATGQVIVGGLQHRCPDGTATRTWLIANRSGRVALSRGYATDSSRFWVLGTGAELPLSYRHQGGSEEYLAQDRDGRDVLLAFPGNPEGQRGDVPLTVECWDVASGRRLEAFRPAVGVDPRVRWDGRTVLSISGDEFVSPLDPGAGYDGTVRWWDPATGRLVDAPWRPRRTAMFSTLSGDSLVLAARCDDQRGRLYDLASGLQRGGDIPLAADSGEAHSRRLAVSPDGGLVLTAATDGTFRLWQTRGSRLQASAASNPRARGAPQSGQTFLPTAFRPDGRVAVVFPPPPERSRPSVLVDVPSGQALGRPLHLEGARHLAFSPDSRLVALAVHPNLPPPVLRIWDAATGRPRTPPLASPKLIHGLAFNPDGLTLAVAGVGGTALWDVEGATIRAFLAEDTTAYRGVFRPDGRRLAVASKSGWSRKGEGAGFRLWDPTTARPVGAFVSTPPFPEGGEFLWLAFAEGGRTLRVFHAPTGRLYAHDAETGAARGESLVLRPAEQVAFGPDGRLLATSFPNGTVRLWDAATGAALEPLLQSPFPVVSLQFNGDGTVVAGVCQDNAVRLWDTATRLPLGPPLLHRASVLSVAFRTDGTVVTVTTTGRTQTWPVPEPVADDLERIQLWIEATGGVQLQGEEVVLLGVDEWRRKKEQLADTPQVPDDAAWHERFARDAEEEGNTFALLWHLDRLDRLRPADWRVAARRGRAYHDAGDAARAAVAYQEAESRQPGEALRDWYRREAARWAGLQKWAESLGYLNRLAAAGGADAQLYTDRSLVHGKLGHAAERDADLDRALERGAESGVELPRVEQAAQAGKWAEAASWCAKASAHRPLDPSLAYAHGLVYLKAGQATSYRRACAHVGQALSARGKPLDARTLEAVVTLGILGPDGVSEWRPLLAAVERGLASLAEREAQAPDEVRSRLQQVRHGWLTLNGAALYRAGQYAKAIDRLRSGSTLRGQAATLRDRVFLALAHFRLGHTDEARTWLDKARTARPAAAFSWEALEAELLLAEAEGQAAATKTSHEGNR
jgi:WD40 repeat protein/tetratricopeptide (TPR) repeat protein